MKKTVLVSVVVLIAFSCFTYIPANNWQIAKTFSIKFSGSGVSGTFNTLKGDIIFDEHDMGNSKFDVTVNAASINTGNSLKNKHATGTDWLDVAKYPEIKFKSSEIVKKADGYETRGMLYMHGVEKQITIPFTFANNAFSGSFELKRSDYKVGSDHGVDGLVAPTLKIEILVPVSK
jgi:polyisoprenoid-binding protein YceI